MEEVREGKKEVDKPTGNDGHCFFLKYFLKEVW
jgi:hypothetical protein